MAINVKAFLEKNGDVKGEIRRFQLPSTSSESYRVLVSKVADLFSLPERGFQLFWQDSDGDFVIFSSSVELEEAVQHSADGTLRVFVKPSADETNATKGGSAGEKTQEEKVFHPGVVCDGCEGKIYGPRYKCVICLDYDLCSSCEGKGIHSEHDKFKITHPQTAGGHGGFMPPHFRRWMHRFMKKCPAHAPNAQSHAGASATGQAKCGESSSRPEQPGQPGDEYLRNVGENIASFLDPFGIDVTYEVRHGDNQKQQGHFRSGGNSTGRCPGGFGGMWHWDVFGNAGGCTRMPQGATPGTSNKEDSSSDKPAEKPAEEPTSEAMEPEEKRPEAEAEVPVAMEEEEAAAKETQTSTLTKESSPAGSSDDGWTMLNEGDTATDGEAAASSESVPRDGIYPNLKVTQAVEMMKAMGFNDDGGWLTRLLETTDGDIAQALDTLKLSAQQASRLA